MAYLLVQDRDPGGAAPALAAPSDGIRPTLFSVLYCTVSQVSAVRWESSMASMFRSGPADLLPQVFECGPGRGLSAILGKVNGKAAKNCKFISC